MVSLLMVVIAALWAAVLVPPLIRDRLENRSNSSVSDFRQQLSSLQRAVPARSNMRTMGARPLAPSALARPAAPGRPGMRGAVGIRGAVTPRRGRGVSDATLRGRTHGDPTAGLDRRRIEAMELKRRRTNVLVALAITAVGSGLFAFTSDSKTMMAVFALTVMAISGYMFMLAQDAQTRQVDEPRRPTARRGHGQRRAPAAARRDVAPARRRNDESRRADRWDDEVDDDIRYDRFDRYADVDDEPMPAPRRRPAAASAAAFDPGMRQSPVRDDVDAYDDVRERRRRPARAEQLEFVDERPAPKPARRGKLTMPPTVVPPSVGGGAIDPLLPSWRAEQSAAPAPVAAAIESAEVESSWRDDDTETISSVARNGAGTGTSGRISYGRNKFSRLGGADGYTMPAPRGDVAGRDADWVARSITPARNGRHATGQNPVLRRTPAAR